jgi:hypothetical protein
MEALFLPETSVNFYRSTVRHITEYDTTHLYSCSLIADKAEELRWITVGGDMAGS